MNRIDLTLLLGWCAVATMGCGSTGQPAEGGSLHLLTYNVAGLPQGLNEDTQPAVHMPLISPLLNDFELVLVQEDFAYHDSLVAEARHAHQSEPKVAERLLNDGLNRFSDTPFGPLTRQTWAECNGGLEAGSDCLADKGFSVSTHSLGKGIGLDVYNLHMDAGGDDIDAQVRAAQVDQLLAFIENHSGNGPVLVAGDTNLKPAQRPIDAVSFDRLLSEAGLVDACAHLACGDDRIDRVLFRPGGVLPHLEPTGWRLPEGFVDGAGQDLSDHLPVEVELAWETEGQ